MTDPMVVVEDTGDNNFPFKEYIADILSVLPESDLIGIAKISIVRGLTKIANKKNDSYARYLPIENGKRSEIEINYVALLRERIPKYLFKSYPEIAALLLSEYIYHEIGHHIHLFKKHGIRKRSHEFFANKYAKRGYFKYLFLKQKEILLSYKFASWNILMFDKEERKMFREGRKELLAILEQGKNY